jgi:regulator of sigma E protease
VSVLIAILGLAFLILIHEAGHFFTAIAVGMRPRSFNIGFGPPLAKIRRKGIDYAVRGIPLGGYVKIPGMYRPNVDDVDTQFGRALREAPELTGPTQSLKRAIADGNEPAARAALEEIEQLAGERGMTGFGRGVQELQDGLSPYAYWRQRTWKRVAVIAAGPLTNFVFALLLFAVIFMMGARTVTTTVDETLPRSPALAAGLRPGDKIVTINGQPVTSSDLTQRIRDSKGQPLTLVVLRDGSTQTLGPVRAVKNEETGLYQLGFRLKARSRSFGVGEAFWRSIKLTGVVTRETVKSLGNLVHKEGRDQVSSPVGIVKVSSSAAHESWVDYLGVLGFISLSLALLNMLPLLPLDGGHIAFALIEAVRGRTVSRAIYERFSAVGIALVLLLFFVGLTNDVGRLGGG